MFDKSWGWDSRVHLLQEAAQMASARVLQTFMHCLRPLLEDFAKEARGKTPSKSITDALFTADGAGCIADIADRCARVCLTGCVTVCV